eukprot:TRINITY_DN30642_c0_g1_i1.p1 TRINITY_DN30642_c0_g1~~TRINITY_DN30642_c0_g1_i1.p1  ORF type:complete len:566 (-),score=101.97 TRINITY_DN30642_c0_g1_i1:29-1726(-)
MAFSAAMRSWRAPPQASHTATGLRKIDFPVHQLVSISPGARLRENVATGREETRVAPQGWADAQEVVPTPAHGQQQTQQRLLHEEAAMNTLRADLRRARADAAQLREEVTLTRSRAKLESEEHSEHALLWGEEWDELNSELLEFRDTADDHVLTAKWECAAAEEAVQGAEIQALKQHLETARNRVQIQEAKVVWARQELKDKSTIEEQLRHALTQKDLELGGLNKLLDGRLKDDEETEAKEAGTIADAEMRYAELETTHKVQMSALQVVLDLERARSLQEIESLNRVKLEMECVLDEQSCNRTVIDVERSRGLSTFDTLRKHEAELDQLRTELSESRHSLELETAGSESSKVKLRCSNEEVETLIEEREAQRLVLATERESLLRSETEIMTLVAEQSLRRQQLDNPKSPSVGSRLSQPFDQPRSPPVGFRPSQRNVPLMSSSTTPARKRTPSPPRAVSPQVPSHVVPPRGRSARPSSTAVQTAPSAADAAAGEGGSDGGACGNEGRRAPTASPQRCRGISGMPRGGGGGGAPPPLTLGGSANRGSFGGSSRLSATANFFWTSAPR